MSNARNLANLKPSAAGLIETNDLADASITIDKLAATLDLSGKTLTLPSGAIPEGVPAGVMVPFAGATAPTDWLLCYGQTVSRTTYANLFTAIGTTHGAGDGSTTFALPDLRGRVPGGKDDMGGVASSRLTTAGSGVDGLTLGAAGGAQTHTLSVAQIPAHTHTVSTIRTSTGTSGLQTDNGNSSEGSVTSSSVGSGAAHNNTQPTIVLNYIIKT